MNYKSKGKYLDEVVHGITKFQFYNDVADSKQPEEKPLPKKLKQVFIASPIKESNNWRAELAVFPSEIETEMIIISKPP